MRTALRNYASSTSSSLTTTTSTSSSSASNKDGSAMLDTSLADLFNRLDASRDPLRPTVFLTRLRNYFPKFAEMSNHGSYKQHDAEEFQSVLMSALANQLVKPTDAIKELRSVTGSGVPPNVIDTLFGIEMDVEMKCKESNDEPVVHIKEGHRKLIANIDGGAGKTLQINHLHEGISHALIGDLEKHSTILNRNAVWTRTSRIASLPKYLAVHLIR